MIIQLTKPNAEKAAAMFVDYYGRQIKAAPPKDRDALTAWCAVRMHENCIEHASHFGPEQIGVAAYFDHLESTYHRRIAQLLK
jgi:hypothetical protein